MQHESRDFPLRELLHLVSTGAMALPEFQRDFVWDPNRVVDLLDSVSNGWPIGSLLIVQGPQPFGLKQIAGGPEVTPASVRYYLLDGQQRVTALFHALTDSGDAVYYVDLTEDSPEGLPPFRWAKRTRGVPASRGSYAFTLRELIDESVFEERTSALGSAQAVQLRDLRQNRLGFLAGDSYRVPSIVMTEDIELEALTRIFETLNRTGVRLDAFDLMVAVLYPHNFHLRDAWDEAIDRFPLFRDMDTPGLEVLKVIALWQRDRDRSAANRPVTRRVKGIRQRDVLNVPADFVKSQWESALVAYEAALRFLRQFGGVTDGESLPSEAMVLTIAYLLSVGHHPGALEAWYWRAIATQSYAQGANTQVLSDIDRFPLGLEPTASLRETLRGSLLDPVRRNRILRLGLRGLARRRNMLDPLTAAPLAGPVRDLSLPLLMEGSIGSPGDTLTVDLLFCSATSLSNLRGRSSKGQPLRGWLDQHALSSQGFIPAMADQDLMQSRLRRVDIITAWMEPML